MSNDIGPKLSLVIPVYNEAGSVSELHAELLAVLRSLNIEFEIIFVDDGSTDGTLVELKKLEPVKVISLARNFGKSQALQVGFEEAKGDYVITMDGDLQDDPSEIPKFLKAIENSDLVCGWKVNRLDPWSKRFASSIANLLVRWFAGSSIHDMNCCFKIYRKEVVKSLRLYGDMHRFIPALVAGMGFSVSEIKVNHRARVYGKSKYGAGRLLWSFFDFTTLIFMRRFTDRPMHFFGLLGSILSFVGFIVLVYLSWIKIFHNVLIGNRPLLILGVLLVLIGLQFVSVGLLGELVIRQKNSGDQLFVIKEKFER